MNSRLRSFFLFPFFFLWLGRKKKSPKEFQTGWNNKRGLIFSLRSSTRTKGGGIAADTKRVTRTNRVPPSFHSLCWCNVCTPDTSHHLHLRPPETSRHLQWRTDETHLAARFPMRGFTSYSPWWWVTATTSTRPVQYSLSSGCSHNSNKFLNYIRMCVCKDVCTCM